MQGVCGKLRRGFATNHAEGVYTEFAARSWLCKARSALAVGRGANRGTRVFAYGENSHACRRLASGRRSARGNRTRFAEKNKKDTLLSAFLAENC